MSLFGLLNRTLFWSVLQAIIGVICVICAIDFLFALLDQMSQLSQDFTIIDAILMVLLELPVQFIEFASVASLIGTLIILGLMASNGELVVMRAAGWSELRILTPAIIAALVIASFSVALAEFVVPSTSQLQVTHERASTAALWFRDGDTFVQVKRVTPSGQLIGVTLIDIQNKSLTKVRSAQDARYDHKNKYWLLSQVSTSGFQDNQVIATTMAQEVWRPQATPQELQFIGRAVESLSISELINYIKYRQEQGLTVRRHRLTLWQTLLQPLANVVMVLLASSLVFGSMRMVSMGYRVTIGLMFGLGFFYTQDLFGFLSLVYGVHPLLCLLVPIAFFLSIALRRFKIARA